MPITGQETVLASQLETAIRAAVAAKFGGPIVDPQYIDALSKGIANAIIPFLTSNVQVNPGQSVAVTGSTGTVDSDGTIS